MAGRDDLLPVAWGLGLVLGGALLSRWRPETTRLPAPRNRPRLPDPRDARDLARQTRETVAQATPDNLTEGVGRALMAAGAGLILVTALDLLEASDP